MKFKLISEKSQMHTSRLDYCAEIYFQAEMVVDVAREQL